jgi:hypothetical protein
MRLKKFNEFMNITDGEIDNIFYQAKTYILENNLVENDYHNNEHMINVFDNAMILFNHYKDEYKLIPYHKIVLGLAALFHDFNHSGGKLKDSENIELALVALKEFLVTRINFSRVTINKSELYDDIENIIIATEFPHLDIDLDILQKIIRDADTMGGIIDGWKSVVANLASEYNKTLEEFIPTQIKFLDTVKFNTDYCNGLLKDNKEKIIEELNKMK